ncbi:Zinc finger PMZ-type, partial [Arabidopsis thaliana x Arabidopsis arenosa]
SQNSIDFLVEEEDDSISEDEASVSEFEEEDDIASKEEYVETKEIVALEANKENEKQDELCIGMEFSSDETAHTAYKQYGGNHGFNVRKQRRTKKQEKIVRLVYVCSKEGYRKEPKVIKSYSQPITRCGCNAHMTCYLQNSGRYKIVSFEPNHNHDLVRTPMKHLLKGNRAISVSQKQHANDADMSGISAKATVEMMSREVGGKKEGNSSFFYSMQLDEDDMITNIFWADDRSISDYNLFGDVVCFDTTYKTNEYDRPFAPFVGVNHHKQTVLFGAALLYDETTESYKWLFETFLGAMSGKQPKTILTDQCAAMANAIVKRVLEDRRYKELVADFNMMHTSPVLCATVEMLQHAEEVYTPEVFSLFQKQYIVIGDYVAKKVSKSEMVYEYKVSYRGVAREHLVNYDAANETIDCGCMKFSFAGILCRHALKVLDKKNIRRIPSTYILNRWTKEAKARSISYYHSKTPNETVKQSIGRRYSHICRIFREIAYVAADHIELTMCANEDALQLLKKMEEKKKELVKTNAWMPQSSDVELVEEEEEEEEDKEVPNARGIKRKAP